LLELVAQRRPSCAPGRSAPRWHLQECCPRQRGCAGKTRHRAPDHHASFGGHEIAALHCPRRSTAFPGRPPRCACTRSWCSPGSGRLSCCSHTATMGAGALASSAPLPAGRWRTAGLHHSFPSTRGEREAMKRASKNGMIRWWSVQFLDLGVNFSRVERWADGLARTGRLLQRAAVRPQPGGTSRCCSCPPTPGAAELRACGGAGRRLGGNARPPVARPIECFAAAPHQPGCGSGVSSPSRS